MDQVYQEVLSLQLLTFPTIQHLLYNCQSFYYVKFIKNLLQIVLKKLENMYSLENSIL